jgi:hypothetical protein
MSDQFYLTVISGTLSGNRLPVSGKITLGRNPSNSLFFQGADSGTVSGFHAEIIMEGNRLFLVDKNSTNGTFVNGQNVSRCELRHNDVVGLGMNGPKIQVSVGDGTQHSNLEETAMAGNYTMNLAEKISRGQADQQEMGNLIKDSQRIGRMEAAKMVDDRDIRMIKSASETYRKSRKKALIIISSISAVALVIVTILGIQNISYRKKLDQQTRLLTDISRLNDQLDKAEDNPDVGDEEKLRMLSKLRAQERMLARLRRKIAPEDLAQLYKDPLGIEIHKAMESFGEDNYIVPDIFIQTVNKHIKNWQRSPRFIRKAFANKNKHASLILRELDKENIPAAFLYLALHESGLDSVIISRAGARGIWQFMPRTGRDYGLEVPEGWRKMPVWKDERTNPLKSTRAAIKYLKVLLGQCGTGPLAMAAYNAGEGRISRELRRIDDPINNRDFWYIYRSGTLSPETNEYVPKIVATMVIDQNREKYGF